MRIRAIAIGQIIPFLYKNESILSFMQENLENFSNLNKELTDAFKTLVIPSKPKDFVLNLSSVTTLSFFMKKI